MEYQGNTRISKNCTAQQYLNLNLCIQSDEKTWEKAINILKERFKERFFGPIHYLSWRFPERKNDPEKIRKNGFAIMALNCLLIDTFYQFEYGRKDSNLYDDNNGRGRVGNKGHYTAFLERYFGNIFLGDSDTRYPLAEIFYADIRCGILHSAQTYFDSKLSADGGKIVEYVNRSCPEQGIRVDVGQISIALEKYFQDYIARLKSGDERTRENFIEKMKYVCNASPEPR